MFSIMFRMFFFCFVLSFLIISRKLAVLENDRLFFSLMIRLLFIFLYATTLWLLVTFLMGNDNFVGEKFARTRAKYFYGSGTPCLDERVAFR